MRWRRLDFDQFAHTIGFLEFIREALYRFSNASNSTLNSIFKALHQTRGAISISTPNYLAFALTLMVLVSNSVETFRS